MCTFVFLKTAEGHLLGMNRDEAPGRAHSEYHDEGGLFYPRDPGSGGTWLGVSREGHVAALLNARDAGRPESRSTAVSRGAVVPHQLAGRSPGCPSLEGMAAFQSFFHDPASDSGTLQAWDGTALAELPPPEDPCVLIASGYGAADERQAFVRDRLRRDPPRDPRGMMELLSLREPSRRGAWPHEAAVCMTGPFSATVASSVVEIRGGRLSFWCVAGSSAGPGSYELVKSF